MFAEALAIKDDQAQRGEGGAPAVATVLTPEEMAKGAREQSRILAAQPSDVRAAVLLRIADALESRVDEILAANQRDMAAAKGNIDENLTQRLLLRPKKVQQLAEGIRQIAKVDEPIGKLLARTELAEVLLLPASCAAWHQCVLHKSCQTAGTYSVTWLVQTSRFLWSESEPCVATSAGLGAIQGHITYWCGAHYL